MNIRHLTCKDGVFKTICTKCKGELAHLVPVPATEDLYSVRVIADKLRIKLEYVLVCATCASPVELVKDL